MKAHKGFILVHKHRFMKWYKPDARVFINTFDDSIVALGKDNDYAASFQTIEPGNIYSIPCKKVDLHTHSWLYRIEFVDHCIPEATEEHPVYNVMCCKELK